MPRIVHIRDSQYKRYIVASDVWDGAVHHEENKARPNAVWALLLWDKVGDKEIYRLIDLRHGCHLANSYQTLVKGRHLQVANIPVLESGGVLDIRAQWTRKEVAPQTGIYTLQNAFDGRYLCANGSNDGISLGADPGSPNARWEFETAESGYFLSTKDMPPRLPITGGRIIYLIDTSNAPAGLMGPGKGALLAAFDDAVSKWIRAFVAMGASLKTQPSGAVPKMGGPPPDITFCWGKVRDPGEGANTPSYQGTGSFSDRSTTPRLTVTLDQDKWWSLSGGAVQFDVRSVVAHELGHVFGLEHSADPLSVMRPKIYTGEVWTHEGDPICPSDMLRLRARYIDTFFLNIIFDKLVPIYRHQSRGVPDLYFYDTTITSIDSGYKEGERAFEAYTFQVAGAEPIYKHSAPNPDRYYYDTQLQNDYGWNQGQVAFYAFTAPRPGAIPIYRHRAPDPDRYYYDTQLQNDYGWSQGEVAFWAYPNGTSEADGRGGA
jgi:hypothetical protein